MRNIAEVPEASFPDEGGTRETDKKTYAGQAAEVIDILTKRKLAPEDIDRLKKHQVWQITIDETGIHGLPDGVSEKDVIRFKGSDGRWYAQNPTPELMEEKRRWRHDWDWSGDKEVRRDGENK